MRATEKSGWDYCREKVRYNRPVSSLARKSDRRSLRGLVERAGKIVDNGS